MHAQFYNKNIHHTRVKEMQYPLCCSISIEESHDEVPEANNIGSPSFAGVLYKWTNYGKGWRPRWFLLRSNGVLTYSKLLLQPQQEETLADVSFIGDDMSSSSSRHSTCQKSRDGIVHLKVSAFRESRSDDKRFYIFTATNTKKTLHLKTTSNKQRLAWIQALTSSSTKTLFSFYDTFNVSLSTQGLRNRLVEEGVGEEVVKDCEQLMFLEFDHLQTQLRLLCQGRSTLLDTLRHLEAANTETEASGRLECEYPLAQQEYSDLRCGKYSGWSTTESSDDVEKQELEETSEDDETYFFDTEDCFPQQSTGCETIGTELKMQPNVMADGHLKIVRREKLPDPAEKEKGVNLWSLIKDNIGKDLTRVCLPVYFNEPISSLQKCFEDLEYSYLLDRAYQHGKEGNSLQRALNVAAFAVSGYASSEGRHCKPFNPLLGETYEADFPDKGVRFFSEKVSHHPTLIACHSEGRGWKFWGDSNIRTKFWGTSIQLDPVGILTLEFDDGEIFQWSKVTTSIYNLILGKVYCDHHGLMHIRGNREYSCKLRFKEQHILERNPRRVHGFVEDASGKKRATLFGKWDDSMYYINGVANVKPKDVGDANLLWRRTMPPTNLTRYNLTSFAITLNELTPGLQEKLPPTDSRLRPDQRHLENGEYDMANSEKLRLETRQRMSRRLQENGWKPRWFQRDGEEGTHRYVGGYWEKREERKWDGCPNIFGEISTEINDSSSRS